MPEHGLSCTADKVAEVLCKLAEGLNKEPDEQTVIEIENVLDKIQGILDKPYGSYFRKIKKRLKCKNNCSKCLKRFFCQTYYCFEKCNGVYCEECSVDLDDCSKKFRLKQKVIFDEI